MAPSAETLAAYDKTWEAYIKALEVRIIRTLKGG